MMLVIVIAIVRDAIYFYNNEYFPQPFFYEPYDIWMDWFNVTYWAYEPGAYDSWGTVYPPFSFVFLRIFSWAPCYQDTSSYLARECDKVGLFTLFAFFFLNVTLLWRTFRKWHRPTALWRTIALGFGLPELSGLERGNLVVVAFTCIILGFGPLLKSARWRWLMVGMAINLKVYVVAAIFPQLLRRKWLWFEGAIASCIVVYAMSFMAFGDGTPAQLYRNIFTNTSGYQAMSFNDLWSASTYNPLMSMFRGQYQFVANIIGSKNVDLVLIIIPAIQGLAVLSIVAAAIAGWLRPEIVSIYRLTFYGLALAMLLAESGGYTGSFLVFFVFLERWTGVARPVAIVCAYILLIPADIILDKVPDLVQESYLTGHYAFFSYYVTVSPLVRPLFILIMTIAMSWTTLFAVGQDIRMQGWRGRWRYRLDVPLLPGILPPQVPEQVKQAS